MPRVADRVLTPPSGELLPRFVASLDPEWIDEALQATGTATIRRRRLPPAPERRCRPRTARRARDGRLGDDDGSAAGRPGRVPTTPAGRPVAAGDLDKADIRRSIKCNFHKIQDCYDKQRIQ